MVEQLAAEVAVPPEGEVDADACHGVQQVAPVVAYAFGVRGPHLPSRVLGIDIGGQSAPHVIVVGQHPEDLSGLSVTELAVVFVFVHVPQIEVLREGQHGTQMHGVAVTQAGVVVACAVVVHAHRAVGNLVASVAIDVGHAQVVVALSGVFGPPGLCGVKHPALLQLLAVPVPCGQHAARVVSATHHHRGVNAVEIGHAGQIALRAVGIVVAPGSELALSGHVVHGGEGFARPAFKHGEVFRTALDEAAASSLLVLAEALRGVAVGVVVCLAVVAHPHAIVGFSIADHASRAVHSAVGGLHHQLGPAVAIEVVGHHLGVVGAAAYVAAHGDAPEAVLPVLTLLAVQAVGVDIGLVGHAALRVVARVGGVPFQDEFHLAVAVEVGHRGVVGVVGHGFSVVALFRSGAVERDGEIAYGRSGLYGPAALRLASCGAHAVGGALTHGVLVHEGGGLSCAAPADDFAVAQDFKFDAFGVALEVAPRDEHVALVAAHGHDAAPQLLALHLVEIVGGLCCCREACDT